MTQSTAPATTSPPLLGAYAGFATRAVALLIDLAVITVTLTVLGVVVVLLTPLVQFSQITLMLLQIMQYVMTVTLLCGYFIVTWMLSGQTVGQALMGVRVVRTDGGYVTFWVAFRRLIGYVISAILFVGFLWVLWDDRRQGLHDKFAHTYVVYAWSGPQQIPDGPIRQLRQRRRPVASPQQRQ